MKVLITGITGTLGTALTDYILSNTNWNIVGLSRDEQKQYAFRAAHTHADRVDLLLGDIRSRETVARACEGVHLVYHLAALKCVDVLEAFPSEAYLTNYIGTENIVNVLAPDQKLIFVSTDKAVKPINAYGYSKAMAEKLVLTNKNYTVCRYGNVLGSRGSVLPKFMHQIKNNLPLEVTHIEMSRFWVTAEDIVEFVFNGYLRTGLHIPNMKAASILRVTEIMKKMFNSDSKLQVTGIRPGEKLHEDITEHVNSKDCEHYSNEELELLLRKVLCV